jgi:hypothetical protein
MIGATVLLVVAALAFFWVKFYKDSYDLLPINTKKEVLPEQRDPAYADWYEFTAPADEFKVSLPLLPQQATQQVSDPTTKEERNYDIYAAQKADGTIFMISRIAFPNKPKEVSTEDLMKDVMNDMATANPKNKLLDVKKGEFDGAPANDFTIENDVTTIYARAFARGRTIYILSMISKNEHKNKNEFDHFIKSFGLKNKDKRMAEESPSP